MKTFIFTFYVLHVVNLRVVHRELQFYRAAVVADDIAAGVGEFYGMRTDAAISVKNGFEPDFAGDLLSYSFGSGFVP